MHKHLTDKELKRFILKEWSVTALTLLVVACLLYYMAAEAVFVVRHPWATETERLLHTGDVLRFR